MRIDPQAVYLIANGIDLLFKRIEMLGIELSEEERAVQTAIRKEVVQQARDMAGDDTP
jgi:hypothetical protein